LLNYEKEVLPIIELPLSIFILGINIEIQNHPQSIKAFYLENVRQLHTTADKRLRCYAPSPKLWSATSFIRKTLKISGIDFLISRLFYGLY